MNTGAALKEVRSCGGGWGGRRYCQRHPPSPPLPSAGAAAGPHSGGRHDRHGAAPRLSGCCCLRHSLPLPPPSSGTAPRLVFTMAASDARPGTLRSYATPLVGTAPGGDGGDDGEGGGGTAALHAPSHGGGHAHEGRAARGGVGRDAIAAHPHGSGASSVSEGGSGFSPRSSQQSSGGATPIASVAGREYAGPACAGVRLLLSHDDARLFVAGVDGSIVVFDVR